MLWRLHKALPGLKGGSVAWGARIDGILGSSPLNFRRSRVDPYWSPHGRLHQDRSARGSTSCHGIPGACGNGVCSDVTARSAQLARGHGVLSGYELYTDI